MKTAKDYFNINVDGFKHIVESLTFEQYMVIIKSIEMAMEDSFYAGCDSQREAWIKQMPIAKLVRREISSLVFVEHLNSQPKPKYQYLPENTDTAYTSDKISTSSDIDKVK